MSVATEMMPGWKNWEGDLVDGEFLLEHFLGGGERSGVFRTRLPSGDASIKLVPAGATQAKRLVERWSRAAALDHPHLIGIVRTGTWVKGGIQLAYVVTELAEESLGAVLVDRALTAEETLELLQPAADVLTYLHHRGFVHGSLKPSNVFAVKDKLKLSSDAVSAGDASADLRALAATVVHALTQQPLQFTPGDAESNVVKSLPEPFSEIARNCIGYGGRPAWSAAHLASWLQSQRDALSDNPATATRPSRSTIKRLSYAILLLSILGAVVGMAAWLRNRTAAPLPIASPSMTKPLPPVQDSQPAPEPQKAPALVITPSAGREPKSGRIPVDTQQEVVHQVLPDIPAEARRTVRGTATVAVRVAVDPSGDVTNATLEPGGSRYFGRLALQAARKWRFVPSGTATPRELSLRFEITRTGTTVRLERLAER